MGHSPDQAHAGANVHRARGQLMETCGSARRGGQRRRARSGAGAANLLLIDRHRRPAASPVLVAANLLLRPPRGVAGAAAERAAAHGDVLLVRAVPRWEEASGKRPLQRGQRSGMCTKLIWHQERYISQVEALHTAPASYRSNWRYISLALHIGPAAMCSAGAGTYRPGLLCTASGNIAQHWREKRSRDHTTSG